MKRNIFKVYILLAAFGLMFTGCADLEVPNENEPDARRALANVDDVKSLAGGAFRTIFNQMHEYSGTAMGMDVMADHSTCSWGNAGMKELSWEPRIYGFTNSLTYAYFYVVDDNWGNAYSAISSVNDVLNQIEDGADFGEDAELVEAFCYFVSGVAHGWIGLTVDQGNLLLYDSDPAALEMVPWDQVIDASLTLLDKAIAIAEASTFTVPANWIGVPGGLTSAQFAQLANSYAARTMAYQSRTKAHNDALDWDKIADYASKGVDGWDYIVELGDSYDFYDMAWVYLCYSGWGRTDMRIANAMDHNYPSRWPADGTWPNGDPGEADPSNDARLTTDFEYLPDQEFPPDRGRYQFSHYRFKRYDYLYEQAWYGIGEKPFIMEWEMDLLQAEALYRDGDEAGARAILNDPEGARKVRGGCPDVTASGWDLLHYILDEKDIECYITGAGTPYFDMRRTDRLTQGTILHFPVPATELESSNIEWYTINAVADGVQGSAEGNGWTGWD
jgi:hypothetical protein